jgi:lactobin A/cerein 7B family class IIb bacteriocin
MEKVKFISLTEEELKSTQGGWLLFVAGALVAGTVYGYVKEKLDSGQW